MLCGAEFHEPAPGHHHGGAVVRRREVVRLGLGRRQHKGKEMSTTSMIEKRIWLHMEFDPGLGRRFKSVRGHLPTSPRGNRSVLGPVHPQWQVHPFLRPGLDGKVVGTLDRSMFGRVHGCRSNWEAGTISN